MVLHKLSRNYRYRRREPPVNSEELAVNIARIICVDLLVLCQPRARTTDLKQETVLHSQSLRSYISRPRIEEIENEVTLWNTIATHWVYLPHLVDTATLTGIVEERSSHGRLNKPRTKGVDADVGALKLPRSRLRNGVYTRILM